ncbi:MAG: VIT and vWA domain-containing protein [Candidatus Aminicenantaceae bacterium]
MKKHINHKLMARIVFYFLLIITSRSLLADGFIIPKPMPGENIPPLTVKYHKVEVEIIDQVANTSIDQVFINNHHRDIEGTFIFPLPEDAAISEFSMYVGNKKIEGEILDKEKAQKIYEDIVRRLKDPALLEYIGRNMFRARVYPIPARGEKRIKLSYTEILKAESDVVGYIYPLNTERFSFHPIKQVSVSVRISAQRSIANIYSPSHKISVKKEGNGKARVSYEESDVKPDKDFILYYSFSEEDIGLSLINWKGYEENYFMFLASPSYAKEKEKIIKKNLIFVLDSSGSMSGKKIKQAKAAANFIIEHLNKNDKFSIIDFDDGVNLFSPDIVTADLNNRKKALHFVKEVEDNGGTNINHALLQALGIIKEDKKPNYILFLTDGLPTVGVTETKQILRNIRKANKHKSRIFVFGVGYDVNTELLDRMALENRGTSVYVTEGENLEVALSNYYEKISSPLLSDLEINFKGIKVHNTYPQILPDLFKGSQLLLIGKYKGEGPAVITLTGKVGKKEQSFTLETGKLVRDESYNFLPRLWATRRIGYLMEEIRLNGERKELVDEVKRLGVKYGIVTPYTSFLIRKEEREGIEMAAPETMEALASQKKSGQGAVKMSRATQEYKAEKQAVHVVSKKIKYKDDKTFLLKDEFWVDSVYEEGTPVIKIGFNSQEYYNLISTKPGIVRYLSVGKNMIIHYRGKNYKIITDLPY